MCVIPFDCADPFPLRGAEDAALLRAAERAARAEREMARLRAEIAAERARADRAEGHADRLTAELMLADLADEPRLAVPARR